MSFTSPSTPGTSATPAAPTAIAWADPAREQAFHAWLATVASAHALQTASVRLASADASFRRYFR
ncbi:MAG TPA: aminoglycoside phosphotransferase, partial [Burkholderiaceae bacterium]|nr:aminoglycoside phosphotransferase [Burkholderiaceae bacterium]